MNKIIVIKYGGSVLDSENENEKNLILKDIGALKKKGFKIVLVHGGSRHIDKIMEKSGLIIKKVDGKRVTDGKTLEILDKCLASLNSEIVTSLNKYGIQATGFHGISGGIVCAKKENTGSLGFVGDVSHIDVDKIKATLNTCVPVISPLGFQKTDGQQFNINADDVAVAVSLMADFFILMTDVNGVLNNGEIVPVLTPEKVKKYKSEQIVSGGMIPKLDACVKAVNSNVGRAIIIRGGPETLLKAVEPTQIIGTTIIKETSRILNKLQNELVAR